MIRDHFNSIYTRWLNWPPFIRLLGVLVIIGGTGLIIAGPGYRHFKKWKMDQNLVKAEKAVVEDRMTEARDRALTFLRSGDDDIKAFRALEKSMASLRDPRHLQIAASLISHPDATREDHLRGFTALVGTTPLGIVGQSWQSLSQEERAESSFAAPFAERLLSEQRLSEAAQVLMGIPEEARSAEVRQMIARVLIATNSQEGLIEAQKVIVNGLTKDPDKISGWLSILEVLPIDELDENLLWPIRKLALNPSDSYAARLAFAKIRLDCALASPAVGPIISETLQKWRESEPVFVAQLLRDLFQKEKILETFTVADLEFHPDLFPALFQAAIDTADWEKATAFLDSAETHFPKFLALFHRTLLASKMGDRNRMSESWREALAEAQNDPLNRNLLELQKLAAGNGLAEFAQAALLTAIRLGRGPLPLYEDLKPLLQDLWTRDQDNILLEVCSIYRNFEPSNPMLFTQYAYLACVNDAIEPTQLSGFLEKLAAALPQEIPVQTTYATVLLSAGEFETAARILAPFTSRVDELRPELRIVFLVTEVCTGKIKADDPQIKTFPWNELRASERRKFEALINQLNPN